MPKYKNFIQIPSVGAELFHVDGRTDKHDEANSSFSQFLRKRLINIIGNGLYFFAKNFAYLQIYVVYILFTF